MKLLALDQSSRISGFAVFEDGKLLDYGHFTFTDKDFGERLMNIKNKVKELIEKYEVDEVIFEDIQLKDENGENISTFKKLAEVFGVVYEYLTEIKMPNSSVLAVVWKSTLEIKGKARAEQKRNAQLYVKNSYGLTCTEDESDAICIGTHYFIQKEKAKEEADKYFDWSS